MADEPAALERTVVFGSAAVVGDLSTPAEIDKVAAEALVVAVGISAE